jgi:hypothetical protein
MRAGSVDGTGDTAAAALADAAAKINALQPVATVTTTVSTNVPSGVSNVNTIGPNFATPVKTADGPPEVWTVHANYHSTWEEVK